MFDKKTIRDVDVCEKRVLVRVDFNIPLAEGKVADDTRIRAALPTLQYLLDQRARVILCSHLGRPKGVVNLQLSLRPVADRLSELLNMPVAFAEDCVGSVAKSAVEALQPGQVVLLENTRFHPEEKKNDKRFARQLAELAEVYVNDAFGTAHRAHASTEGVARLIPAVAGLLMEKEIRYLGSVIANPDRPFVAILGGAKVSDKIGLISNLLDKADQVLIGGGMANTFFFAQGYPVGDSLVEKEAAETARQVAQKGGSKLRLPIDVVIADKFEANAQKKVMATGPIPDGWRILDIGPETVANYAKVLKKARTIVWNGPMGVFELPPFAKGTFGIARAVADSPGVTIVGGGDSVAALRQTSLESKITHISTGGGAALQMLEGKPLPAIEALGDKE
jgi:phosphoglycerate kinase